MNIKDSLWKNIKSRNLTWDDLANGVNIKFNYKGKNYLINSKISIPRTKSFDSFSDILENKAIYAVNNNKEVQT